MGPQASRDMGFPYSFLIELTNFSDNVAWHGLLSFTPNEVFSSWQKLLEFNASPALLKQIELSVSKKGATPGKKIADSTFLTQIPAILHELSFLIIFKPSNGCFDHFDQFVQYTCFVES